jgi:hypothetical protein
MSAQTIQQQNLLPIINDFVIVPDGDKELRLPLVDALTAVVGSRISTFTIDKRQRLFKLPANQSNTGYPEDFYAELREASTRVATSLA